MHRCVQCRHHQARWRASSMGQWSLPNTSLLMVESLTLAADSWSTRKQSSLQPMFLALPPVRMLHQEYLTVSGQSFLKVSTQPVARNLVKLSRSSRVNPAVFSLPLGRAMSISLWQTLRSPQMMTVFFFLSALQQSWKHLSQSLTRYWRRSSFWPALGMQAVSRQNCSNSRASTLPSCECSGCGRSSVTDSGRYLEKMATPEQPAEHLQKFQQPWQPVSLMGSFWQASWSILVSLMQMMSGLAFSMQFGSSFLLMTERMPLTFQELMSSLLGVLPLPYSQRLAWLTDLPPEDSLNCFDLLFCFPDSSGSPFSNSLVCFSTDLDLPSLSQAFCAGFLGGINEYNLELRFV